MEINEFAKMCFERTRRHDKKKLDWEFFSLAMAGECGEMLNYIKKVKRGDFPLDKSKLAEETADAVTYAFILLSELGIDPEKALMDKFEKVNKRLEKGGWSQR
jgi:NTP pyrophosphatase (non-canonical NTP hydrolase)